MGLLKRSCIFIYEHFKSSCRVHKKDKSFMLQLRHPNFNPLQLTTPFTRCGSTGSVSAIGPSLSPSQSSGFELLKLARGNQLNKDLERRRRCAALSRYFDLSRNVLLHDFCHRHVVLQVADLVNEDAADLRVCDRCFAIFFSLMSYALPTFRMQGGYDCAHVVLLQDERMF
jgi:hypothetical protein